MMRGPRRQAGFSRIVLLLGGLGLMVLLTVGVAAAMYSNKSAATIPKRTSTNQPKPKTVAKPADTTKQLAADTPTDLVLQALQQYCQTNYKKVWEGAYNLTIDPHKVTSRYDKTVPNPLVIDGNYAVITAAICDTPQLTQLQKFAPFTLYLQQTQDNGWQAYDREQSLPPCNRFDGLGWPVSVVPKCTQDGVTRAPSATKQTNPTVED